MEDFPSNSQKKKERAAKKEEVEEKKLEKVIAGEAIVKEKGIGKKFKSVFFGSDFKSTVKYVLADVLLPAARDTMFNSVVKGAERAVYGESMHQRQTGNQMRGRVQYNTPVQRHHRSAILPDQPPRRVPQNPTRRESNDVLLADRQEAGLVLSTMIDCVDKYGQVSVADLNELIGQPVANVDHGWGWTNLTTASVRQVRSGYLIELPPMEEI